jgi:hypothetical protein
LYDLSLDDHLVLLYLLLVLSHYVLDVLLPCLQPLLPLLEFVLLAL